MDLIKGKTYYKVTYADPDLTMPGIQPMIFIGKNAYLCIEGEDVDTFQFQDTVSFVRFGFVTELKNDQGCLVELFRQHELGSSIVTLESLPEVISASLERAREKNDPMLSKLSGTWNEGRTETWVPVNKNG